MIDAGSVSSHATGSVTPTTFAEASRAFSSVRAAATTRAPWSASTRIVSKPIPELMPVTRIVLPDRSRSRVTSSAVEP